MITPLKKYKNGIERLKKENELLDKELDLAHQCITELYNANDTNVPIIQSWLEKIRAVKKIRRCKVGIEDNGGICEYCKGENDYPCCWHTECEAATTDDTISSCIHCYAEMRKVGIFWYHHSQFDNEGNLLPDTRPQH